MKANALQECETCPASQIGTFVQLGLNAKQFDYIIALAGNPNVGKSTVFNRLTGLRQHTANWPGKTVTRAEGAFSFNGKRFKVVDLPGTYSLLSTSTDEQIARDFILFGQPDVTVVVVDATCLERNLNLTLQVLGITNKSVVCLNLMDEAERRGIEIDVRSLARDLGVPVVPTVARTHQGVNELIRSIDEVATGAFLCKPRRVWTESPKLRRAVDALAIRLEAEFPDLPNARWVALRLLDGDTHIMDAVRTGELGELAQHVSLTEPQVREEGSIEV